MAFVSTSWRILVFTALASMNAHPTSDWSDTYKLAKSASLFHVSILYNKIRFGKAFSFNSVLDASCADQTDPKLCVCVGEGGKIISIHDGKKSPLLLGAIPRYKEHIDEIRKHANLTSDDPIGLYTLNRDFERSWSGLAALEKNPSMVSHKYPTTDYSAPSFVDLIRAVRDLENAHTLKVRYVHCKAGRGRSAATISAYLMHVCNKAGQEATPQQIEEYLKTKRNRVSINSEQQELLARFAKELKDAGSFNALYANYKSDAEKRDIEIAGK